MANNFNLDFSYAYGVPEAGADFRLRPEDFVVEEELGFNASGEGEHVLLEIAKTGLNTTWVAKQLARFAGVKHHDVGYCGRKDRHARCRQWCSVYLPRQTRIAWDQLQIPGLRIVSHTRHSQKLRPGQHRYNRFRITLRNVDVIDAVVKRLALIHAGVPNYFGEQRFGFDGNNLRQAERWASGELRIRDKKQRGLYISALRAYLFNAVLSERVQRQNWARILTGDVDEAEPTGPLWGRGRGQVTDKTAELEQAVLNPFARWREALEHCGLSQERRQLVCRPGDFSFNQQDGDIAMTFTLPPGQYATSVLREVASLTNRARPGSPC